MTHRDIPQSSSANQPHWELQLNNHASPDEARAEILAHRQAPALSENSSDFADRTGHHREIDKTHYQQQPATTGCPSIDESIHPHGHWDQDSRLPLEFCLDLLHQIAHPSPASLEVFSRLGLGTWDLGSQVEFTEYDREKRSQTPKHPPSIARLDGASQPPSCP